MHEAEAGGEVYERNPLQRGIACEECAENVELTDAEGRQVGALRGAHELPAGVEGVDLHGRPPELARKEALKAEVPACEVEDAGPFACVGAVERVRASGRVQHAPPTRPGCRPGGVEGCRAAAVEAVVERDQRAGGAFVHGVSFPMSSW